MPAPMKIPSRKRAPVGLPTSEAARTRCATQLWRCDEKGASTQQVSEINQLHTLNRGL